MKLLYGDCLEVMKGIPDGSVDAVITDPPYGTTACKWDSVIPLEPMWEQLKRVIKHNGAIVLFGSEPFSSRLRMSNINNYKYDWVWDKVNGVRNHLNAKIQPMRVKENICVFYKKQPTYNPQMRKGGYTSRKTTNGQSETFGKVTGVDYGRKVNGLYPVDILSIKSHNSNIIVHPTQKPVALMEYLIKTYTDEGETILDFTMGSGTTGVACRNTNRHFIGIEKEIKYYDIAIGRIGNDNNRVG